MLPRIYRLPASQFASVKSIGKLVQTPLFGILISPSRQTQPRFGFIISTKLSSSAVVRNRLRRLLSASLYSLLPHTPPGHDFIILAKHPLLTATLEQITITLKNLLHLHKDD